MTRFKEWLSANTLLIILLSLWTVLEFFQANFTELSNIEAYSWVLSHQFEWGYADYLPASGWLMGLSTTFFGDSELGVRLLGVLLQPLFLYLFWATIRPIKASRGLALFYFLLCFSIPIIHLYRFFSTSAAPLLFGSVLLFYSYRRFLRSGQESLLWSVMMGVSCGVIFYSDYLGLLLVVFIILSNWKMLINYRIYVGLAVTGFMISPHILWLFSHDIISFSDYWLHLDEIFVLFNPLILSFFLLLLFRKSRRTVVGDVEKHFSRAMSFVGVGYLVFYVVSSILLGDKIEWILPLYFVIIYILMRGVQRRPVLYKWVGRICGITVILFIVLRILRIIYVPSFFHDPDHKTCIELNGTLEGRPLVTNGDFLLASKMRYYGHNESFSQSSWGDISQYDLRQDYANSLLGQKVAVVLSASSLRDMDEIHLDSSYLQARTGLHKFIYDTISNFKPSAGVRALATLPKSAMSGQRLTLNITVENPYPYSFDLVGDDSYSVFMQLRLSDDVSFEMPVNVRADILPSNGFFNESVVVTIPNDVPTNDYSASFSLIRYPFGGGSNCAPVKIRIVKP